MTNPTNRELIIIWDEPIDDSFDQLIIEMSKNKIINNFWNTHTPLYNREIVDNNCYSLEIGECGEPTCVYLKEDANATGCMSPIQRKIRRDEELIKAYITKHPELKKFVSILNRAAETENLVRFEVSVGQAVDDYTFGSYLMSQTQNPRIRFEIMNDKKRSVPTVSISDSNNGKPVTVICLSDMSNLKIRADCTGNTFDKYVMRFTLEKPTGMLDYDIDIKIDK